MRFKIINKITDKDIILAGRLASEWTNSTLDTLNKGNGFILYVDKFAPLITKYALIKAATYLGKNRLRKAVFGFGSLINPDGEDTIFEKGISTIGLTDKNAQRIEQMLYRRIAKRHRSSGVGIIDCDNTFIDYGVEIAPSCTVYPFNIVKGNTVIGENTVLYPSNMIENSTIGDGCSIRSSYITDSSIGNATTVGPFAYLRQGACIGSNVRIGDFVEIKNSTLSDGVKTAHLAYIGDANVGKCVNVGCGTVFANYDGVNKHKTVVGDGVFIGCNANLIAPLTIGDNAFIAGGSTITDDIPDNAFAIAREKQINKRRK